MTALTKEERRERARQAILEAFAERPRVVDAEYKVIAGKDNRDELPAPNGEIENSSST